MATPIPGMTILDIFQRLNPKFYNKYRMTKSGNVVKRKQAKRRQKRA